jgi:hypothetical protein
MKVRKRELSSMPPWPRMRSRGKPLERRAAWHITSIGLAKTMITASGLYLATFFAAYSPSTSALPRSRSSRVIPGLRGAPEVMITTSESAVASHSSVAVSFVSKLPNEAPW